MKNKVLQQNLMPLLAALIWGTAFVAQSVCADIVPPFAFNAIRSLIAAAVLLPIARAFDRAAVRRGETPKPSNPKHLWIGGVLCGLFLAAAANLQQAAMADTTAGKAGFITALYTVLVPVLGIFLRKRTPLKTWISVLIAVAGLWLLCFQAGTRLELRTADAFLLLCAWLVIRRTELPDNGDLIMISVCVWAAIRLVTEDFRAEPMNLFRYTSCVTILFCAIVWSVRRAQRVRVPGRTVTELLAVCVCVAVNLVTATRLQTAGSDIADFAVKTGSAFLMMMVTLMIGGDLRRIIQKNDPVKQAAVPGDTQVVQRV